MGSIFEKYLQMAERIDPIKCVGHIIRVQGILIESKGPQAIIGENSNRKQRPSGDYRGNLPHRVEESRLC